MGVDGSGQMTRSVSNALFKMFLPTGIVMNLMWINSSAFHWIGFG